MRFLIGTNASSLDLGQRLRSLSHELQTSNAFINYVPESVFLSQADCVELRNLTFRSEQAPFGKVDLQLNNSMVAVSENDIEELNRSVASAVDLLDRTQTLKDLRETYIRFFVPLVAAKSELRDDGSGMSAHWLKGAVFLSCPISPTLRRVNLALNIAHELGHQVLMLYQDVDSLIKNIQQPVYSTIRKTERPAIMSFHAIVAVYFMLDCVKTLLADSQNLLTAEETAFLESKLVALKREFLEGSFAIKDVEFTDLGLLLFNEMLQSYISQARAV
jgi:HEXXH motif-containing protein